VNVVKKILLAISAAALVSVVAGCSAGTQQASDNPAAGASLNVPAPVDAGTTSAAASAAPSTSVPASSTSPASSATKPETKAPKPVAQVSPGVPCTITTGACVDLSSHKAWLLKDGAVVYGPVPALAGKKSAPTPVGNFHVLYKEKMHYSKQFNNAPMPNSVFFYPGDAFHTGSLKTPSNGCVHLSSTASLKFFNTLQVGDSVQVVR
jgi:lipoprotein-anchoring transpeptidase ErfK/SrfK